MSKSVIFPYGITLKDGGNFDTFPAVEVSFKITTNDEKFTIIFEESRNRSVSLRTNSKEAQALRDFVETL